MPDCLKNDPIREEQPDSEPFVGSDGHNLHMFVSRCCDVTLSLEPLCLIACGSCGMPAIPGNWRGAGGGSMSYCPCGCGCLALPSTDESSTMPADPSPISDAVAEHRHWSVLFSREGDEGVSRTARVWATNAKSAALRAIWLHVNSPLTVSVDGHQRWRWTPEGGLTEEDENA